MNTEKCVIQYFATIAATGEKKDETGKMQVGLIGVSESRLSGHSGSPVVRTALVFAGDSGISNHQCQSPAGGLWQCQDGEE